MSPAETERAIIPLALISEGDRVMRICNACRYCEGLCAVFPAMARRLAFTEQDLSYLSNLCHNCGECLPACPYAPPHEFGVNIPKTLAEIRRASYRRYARPRGLSRLFDLHVPRFLVVALGIPFLFIVGLVILQSPSVLFSAYSDAEGAFYRVMPHDAMVALFGAAGLLALAALVAGPMAFWRDLSGTERFWQARALRRALADTMTLRYFEGGGEGCGFSDRAPSGTRRWMHHLTFYGFLLCFAATTVAAIYHTFLGWPAPYPWLSAPVILGSLGGLGLIAGPAGLLWLKGTGAVDLSDREQVRMDTVFLVLLLLTSVTGFLLLFLRESSAMGVALAIHLGVVLGAFLSAPYGKFVHGPYRFVALVKNAIESSPEGSSNEKRIE